MELHQRHFEQAGSRSEEFAATVGLVPSLCGTSNSSTTVITPTYLPLGDIQTQQFALADCTISSSHKTLNGSHQATNELHGISIRDPTDNPATGNIDVYTYEKLSKCETEICSSCHEYILDRTIIYVNSMYWHSKCLRCSHCSIRLDQFPSCFFKEDLIYCKQCYIRHYGKKCSSCRRIIQSTDWVRRARNFVYHLACFACDQCKRQLSTGEEFALQDCRLLCKQHYMELIDGEAGQQKTKTKRVRTTFAEEQLAVLQTHFQIDSNPDGADLERIASITGLSKRVTQVWFQNSRARQKKYQGNKKGQRMGSSGRSSVDACSDPKSPECDSSDGMIFPRSVLTSAEDAMISNQPTLIPTSASIETDQVAHENFLR